MILKSTLFLSAVIIISITSQQFGLTPLFICMLVSLHNLHVPDVQKIATLGCLCILNPVLQTINK